LWLYKKKEQKREYLASESRNFSNFVVGNKTQSSNVMHSSVEQEQKEKKEDKKKRKRKRK
jgi:hypothetical protein